MSALSRLRWVRVLAAVVASVFVGSGLSAVEPASTTNDELLVIVDPPWLPAAPEDEPPLGVVEVATVGWEGCASAGVALGESVLATVRHVEPAVCDRWTTEPGRFTPVLVDGLLTADVMPVPRDGLTVLEPGRLEYGPIRVIDEGVEVAALLEPTDDGWLVLPGAPVRHGAAIVQDDRLVGFFDRPTPSPPPA